MGFGADHAKALWLAAGFSDIHALTDGRLGRCDKCRRIVHGGDDTCGECFGSVCEAGNV